MKGYFITGTDTGVGKTFVTCALARRARELDPARRVFAFKPLETGSDGSLGDDQRALVAAAGSWQEGRLCGLSPLRMPAAPLVAARAQGRTIQPVEVVELCRQGGERAQLTLVEGAGGWRVPITESLDMGGLGRLLGMPVVLVARAGLGTINHSLLTIEAVERDGCSVAALVLSERPGEDAAFTQSNVAEIGRRWPGTILVLRTDPRMLDPLL